MFHLIRWRCDMEDMAFHWDKSWDAVGKWFLAFRLRARGRISIESRAAWIDPQLLMRIAAFSHGRREYVSTGTHSCPTIGLGLELDWDWGEEDPVKSVTPRFLAYGVPWKCIRRGTL